MQHTGYFIGYYVLRSLSISVPISLLAWPSPTVPVPGIELEGTSNMGDGS
jgi:hypothetical protein